MEKKLIDSLVTSASILLIEGRSGFGKTFMVKTAVKKINCFAKSRKQKRRLIFFSPEILTTNEDIDLLQNAIFAKEVTGIVPVIVIKNIELVSTLCIQRLKTFLVHFTQCKTKSERSCLEDRNPIVIMSNGDYDSRLNVVTKSFPKIVLKEPGLGIKISISENFFKEHNISFGNKIASFVDECDDFHILMTRLNELKFGRNDLVPNGDKSKQEKLFDALKKLRLPLSIEDSSVDGVKSLLDSIGTEFAMKTLQFNPPATKDQFDYIDEKKTMKFSKMDQLSEFYDTYSEFDICDLLKNEKNACVLHKTSIMNLPLVKDYSKLVLPTNNNYKKKLEVKRNIDLIVDEYSKGSNSFVSDLDALEIYSFERDMYHSLSSFKPLSTEGVCEETLELLNNQVKSTLLRGLDSFPVACARNAVTSWKPKSKMAKKRRRVLDKDEVKETVAPKKDFFLKKRSKALN